MKHRLLFCLLLLLSLGIGQAVAQPAGTVVQIGGSFTTNISALSRGPDPSKAFQRVMAVYPPSDLQGIASGNNLLSIGFRLRTAAATAVSGTLRVWLRNSTDVNYSLTTDWAYSLLNPGAFQQVYSGPLTIPATAGWFDVPFQTPFSYSGGGFYLAYEWETTTPIAASGSYECDDRIAQALRAATGTSSFPAQLTTVSSFRPQLRVGYLTPGRDAALLRVYGPGKTPLLGALTPYPVQAVVANAGSQVLSNLPVTFTPLAGAGSAVTVILPSLPPGGEATVRLPGLSPTAAAGTYVRYRVSVPATDQNSTNDSQTDSTLVTTGELTYVTGYPNAAFGVAGVGFGSGTGSGTLLCRYPLRAPALVNSIRVRLWNHANNPGNVVFAVLLDEQGRLLARSSNYLLPSSSANISTWQVFTLPQPTRVSGRAFFVGLAQVAPATAGQYFYPLARQVESPVRDSAYYSVVGDSALTGLKAPREFRTLGRFMIEVEFSTVPLAVHPALTPVASADVWPNPAKPGTVVRVRLNALPAGPATLWDMTGRQVWHGSLQPSVQLVSGEYTLPLSILPSGLYILRLIMDGKQLNTRLVID